MDSIEKANYNVYINLSKKKIDEAIRVNNYQKAFVLLLMVLERLDNPEQIEFINYYNTLIKNMKEW